MTSLASPAAILNDRPILSSEKVLHEDYNRKCSFEENFGGAPQWACRQDELTGGKPPVVK
jgi:hypothetical protein